MLFNSLDFILYFVVVVATYFLLPTRYRNTWLLLVSCFFYMMFKVEYILILAGTIVVDYFTAIWMDRVEGNKRKAWLIVSLVANVGVLVVFKYADFFKLIYAETRMLFEPDFQYTNFWKILLPMGLSFHTFQAMSYSIEVYRKHQKPERNFINYGLYVMFFPQLVAGPIERPQNILHQFYLKMTVDYDRIRSGLALIAWGMFQKVVIADRLVTFVDPVFQNPAGSSGLMFWVATFFFSFQIYCDFAGYSNIAIGSAKVLGFDLMKNFDRPYSSTSISEFWRRWHISLSSWFRDYLYIPLGGNRQGELRKYFNLLFVFFVSGLWHGANWNFLIWGGLHGVYNVVGLYTRNIQEKIYRGIRLNRIPWLYMGFQRATVFLLVLFAWSFFRGNYLYFYMSIDMAKKMLFWEGLPTQFDWTQEILLNQPLSEYILGVLFIIGLEVVHFLQKSGSLRARIFNLPAPWRWTIYVVGLLGICIFGVYDKPVQFIYFQF